jgi:hypothetical protein
MGHNLILDFGFWILDWFRPPACSFNFDLAVYQNIFVKESRSTTRQQIQNLKFKIALIVP